MGHEATLPRPPLPVCPTDLEAAVVGLLQELWRRCPTDVGRGMERLPHSDSVRLRRAMVRPRAAP